MGPFWDSIQLAEDFVVFRETVDGVFAEDHVSVDDNVENTPCAFHQRGVDAVVGFDSGGQTGRLGFIVSLHAIGDGDFHASSESWLSKCFSESE